LIIARLSESNKTTAQIESVQYLVSACIMKYLVSACIISKFLAVA